MWSKKWYLKRNTSCDVHLLNELLGTDVPWDDVIVVSADKLRKLWDSLSELRSSVCERRLEKTVLRPCSIACQNCTVYSVFPSGMTSFSKISLFNWECIGRLRLMWTSVQPGALTSAWQHAIQETDYHASGAPELTILASELSQTHALDRATIGIGCRFMYSLSVSIHT
jgi:hypothetical protein